MTAQQWGCFACPRAAPWVPARETKVLGAISRGSVALGKFVVDLGLSTLARARARKRSRGHVMGIVPESEYRFRGIVLVGQRAQARGSEQEIPAAGGRQPKPARGEHAPDM